MSKIAEPNVDFSINEKKIVLKGKLKEECEKGIIITGNSFHELFKGNKKDPKGGVAFETNLEIGSKFRKLDFPDILEQHKLKGRHLSRLSWGSSLPINIKVITFFIVAVLIVMLYKKIKDGRL